MSEWISTAERLPNQGERVLIADNRRFVWTAALYESAMYGTP